MRSTRSSSSLSIRITSNIGLSISKKFVTSINKNPFPITTPKRKLPLTPHRVLILLVDLLMMTFMDEVERQQIDSAVYYFTSAKKDEDGGKNSGDD